MSDVVDDITTLAKGLWTTSKHLLQKPVTEQYPEQKRAMMSRFKGRHRLFVVRWRVPLTGNLR
jgi:formate hydrogenlyase subunit 6/NADH:ubiquinone oxidoreductase subunit I